MNYNNYNSSMTSPSPAVPQSGLIERLSQTQHLLNSTLDTAREVAAKINGGANQDSAGKIHGIGLSGDVDMLHDSMCELNELIITINSRL